MSSEKQFDNVITSQAQVKQLSDLSSPGIQTIAIPSEPTEELDLKNTNEQAQSQLLINNNLIQSAEGSTYDSDGDHDHSCSFPLPPFHSKGLYRLYHWLRNWFCDIRCKHHRDCWSQRKNKRQHKIKRNNCDSEIDCCCCCDCGDCDCECGNHGC